MPAPAAVYVLAVVGTVAASIAFKEFVYDPHIAPKVTAWNEQRRRRREERQRRRQMHQPLSSSTATTPTTTTHSNPFGSFAGVFSADDGPSGGVTPEMRQRYSRKWRWAGGSETTNTTETTTAAADSDSDSGYYGSRAMGGRNEEVELERLVSKEVMDWRREVSTVNGAGPSEIRRRHGGVVEDDDEPLHVLFSHSPSSVSTASTRPTSPLIREAPSQATLRQAPPAFSASASVSARSNTYSPAPVSRSTRSSTAASSPSPSPAAYASPPLVPSLSLSHPVDLLDAEYGIEVLSAPSERADSPFSHISSANISNMSGFSTPAEVVHASPPLLQNPFVSTSSDVGSDSEMFYSFASPPSRTGSMSDFGGLTTDEEDGRSVSGMSGSSWASVGSPRRG